MKQGFAFSENGPRQKRQIPGGCTAIEKRTLVRKNCIFPFNYRGKIFNGCITLNDPDQRLWCSTLVDHNSNHIVGKDAWGHCEQPTCPSDIQGQPVGNTQIIPSETIYDENQNPIQLGARGTFPWLKYGSRMFYSHNCDFKGPLINEVQPVVANQCAVLCEQHTVCTHYTWSPPWGGTCAMKTGGAGFNQDNPIPSANLRCGYKHQ